jgi:hypothetical protein
VLLLTLLVLLDARVVEMMFLASKQASSTVAGCFPALVASLQATTRALKPVRSAAAVPL